MSSYLYTGTAPTSGSDSITVNAGTSRTFTFAIAEYAAVTGIGATTTDQQDTASASGSNGVAFNNINANGASWIVESFGITGGTGKATVTLPTGANPRNSVFGRVDFCPGTATSSCVYDDVVAPSQTFTLNIAWTCNGGTCITSQSALELLGPTLSTGGSSQTTQCYGSCGSVPITLVNTVSTTGVNFNASLTLFYEFQYLINGFVNNVTTNIAANMKSGTFVVMGFYYASCGTGNLPGTPACNWNIQTALSASSLTKGRFTVNGGGQYQVRAGDWGAVAISAEFSGLQLNDTNFGCGISGDAGICSNPPGMLYTTGSFPASINQQTPCTGSSLCNTSGINTVALSLFATGSITTNIPPPPAIGGCVNNFAQLDCLIPAMVQGMCNSLTLSCQSAAALFWIVLLTLFSFGVYVFTFGKIGGSLIGAGYVFIFLFFTWFFIFAGLGLILSFVIVFFFFIGSAVFAKSARGTLGL